MGMRSSMSELKAVAFKRYVRERQDEAIKELNVRKEDERKAKQQKISGDLFNRELVKGHVVIDGIDHPVTPGPDGPVKVFFISTSVGVSGMIKPDPSPSLAEMRGRQKFLHQADVG